MHIKLCLTLCILDYYALKVEKNIKQKNTLTQKIPHKLQNLNIIAS